MYQVAQGCLGVLSTAKIGLIPAMQNGTLCEIAAIASRVSARARRWLIILESDVPSAAMRNCWRIPIFRQPTTRFQTSSCAVDDSGA